MSIHGSPTWALIEPILVAFFLATWSIDLLAVLGIVDLRGSLEVGLYPLYSTAAASGWLAGNLYVARSTGLPSLLKRKLWLVYFLGPPGFLYLLRAMASAETQRAAPLVPLYALGVFGVLFLVPVLLPRPPPRRSFRAARDDREARTGALHGGSRDAGGASAGGRSDGEDRDPPVVP